MQSKKLLLLIFICLPFLSCTNGETQTKYSVVFNIREILLDGKSFQFSPVKTLALEPNSDQIEEVFLDRDRKVGVKYVLSEQVDPEGRKLVHNAVFYEFIYGSWTPLTELDHREPAKFEPKTHWRIATTVDDIQRFSVDFDYTISAR
jgi:hypothetical protein